MRSRSSSPTRHLSRVVSFDLVFTGIGALCWLPSVGPWAGVVASLLKPGGRPERLPHSYTLQAVKRR